MTRVTGMRGIVMNRFESLKGLLSWFATRAQALAMEVEEILLGAATGWTVNTSPEGQVTTVSSDKGFFRLAGLYIAKANGREIPGWDQTIIADDKGGIVVLITSSDREQVLLRALAQPGFAGYELEFPSSADAGLTFNSRVCITSSAQFS